MGARLGTVGFLERVGIGEVLLYLVEKGGAGRVLAGEGEAEGLEEAECLFFYLFLEELVGFG